MKVETLSIASIEQFRHYIIGKGSATNTVKAYSTDLKMLLLHVQKESIPMQELETEASMWLNMTRLQVSPRTTGRRLVSVRAFAKWAGLSILGEYRAPSPGASVPHPIPEGKAGILAMLDACRTRNERALVGVMGLCGARVSEALSSKSAWIDPRESLITIRGKGDKTRIVPVSEHAWESMREAWVFAEIGTGEMVGLKDRQARHVIKTIGQRAGLSREVSSHDLRHTFATELLNSGVNIRVVQELLGHTSVETTQGYTGVSIEAMRVAVANL